MANNWKNEVPWENYKWAKFACVNKDGRLMVYKDKPLCVEKCGFWWNRISYSKKPEVEFEEMLHIVKYTGDWKNTLIERPKEK